MNSITRLELQVIAAMLILTALLFTGTMVYRHLEGWGWIDAFYFCVTTLTTVGYGDFYPTTEQSRLFTAFYLIVGVGISLSALAVIGKNYLQLTEDRLLKRNWKRKKKDKKNPNKPG